MNSKCEQFSAVPPRHGGGIIAASRQFNIPVVDWLDLSTGINPDGYPIPAIPQQYFHRLPEDQDSALQAAIDAYYGTYDGILGRVVADGSQRFIAALPSLRHPCNVLLPDVGYQEHAFHWARHGHRVFYYNGFDPRQIGKIMAAETIDVVVVINPCNPTNAVVAREMLLGWREQLAARDGWLIVDEAFIDLTPERSVIDASELPGMIVLRSLGKFFGLAGLRVGFCFAPKTLRRQLSQAIGPWAVAGPSQYVAGQALANRRWQGDSRTRLRNNSAWMANVLTESFSGNDTPRLGGMDAPLNAGLFVSMVMDTENAKRVDLGLAAQGILIRHWPLPSQYGDRALLRFGLIGSENETGRERFRQALSRINLAPAF